MISTTLLAVLAIVALIAFIGRRVAFPNRYGIPGPTGLPFVGSLLEIMPMAKSGRAHELFGRWISEFGGEKKTVSIVLPGATFCFTGDAELAKQVLNKPEVFGNDQNFKAAFGAAVPQGLLILEGEQWKRHRKLVQAAFFPQSLRYVLEVTNDECDRALKVWKPKVEMNMHSQLAALALDVVARSAFGVDLNALGSEDYREFQESLDHLTSGVEARILTPPAVWNMAGLKQSDLDRACEVIRAEVRKALAVRTRGTLVEQDESDSDSIPKKKKDLMAMLLDAKADGEQPLTDAEVEDEVLMFFLAGHETSSNTLCWAIYELAKNPECVEKVRREIDEVLGSDGKPQWDDLPKLKYIDMVLKETLRFHNTVPVSGRTTFVDTELAVYKIPKGTNVGVHIESIHLDPRYYPNPLKFDPERWSDEGKAAKAPFFPFGYGPKACVGRKMAWLEMQVVLARIFQKASFVLNEEKPVQGFLSVTLGPKKGLFASIVPRN